MTLRLAWTLLFALLLSLGAVAQQDNGGIKQDTKDAAHATGRAAKKTGRKIKHGTKKHGTRNIVKVHRTSPRPVVKERG